MDRIKDMASGFNPADIQQYLQGVDWPIGKDDLVAVLQSNGAPGQLVDKIRGSDQSRFNGPQDVVSSAQGS
ncbi:MAG TPA: DUF2795 domain-containing protein [Chloroflexota bacterium]|nr:DUF2795 domain-containing protein [Chloroflexota bacterium]